MTFDPTTAYAGEYQWQNFIDNVTWEIPDDAAPVRVTGLKGRWGDFDTPDLISVAAGLGLSSEAAAIVVWQPIPSGETVPLETFKPKPGQILRREDESQEGWVIRSVSRSRFGHWQCLAEREVANG